MRPKEKQLMIGIGVVVVIGAIVGIISVARQTAERPSDLTTQGSNVRERANEEISPEVEQQLTATSILNAEEAALSGESSLSFLNDKQVEQATPETEVAPPQQDIIIQEVQPPLENPDTFNKEEAIKNQFNSLLPIITNSNGGFVLVQNAKNEQQERPLTPQELALQAVGQQLPNGQLVVPPQNQSKIIARGGEILWGITANRIDTDAPSIVRIRIVDDRFPEATAIGTANRSGEQVSVTINRIFTQEHTLDANAILVDTETGNGLLTGKVDRKIMQRYFLPFALAFIGGAGEAISERASSTKIDSAGSTSVATISSSEATNKQVIGKAIGTGVQNINTQLGKDADKAQTQVVIEPGVAVGVFLLDDLTAQAQ